MTDTGKWSVQDADPADVVTEVEDDDPENLAGDELEEER